MATKKKSVSRNDAAKRKKARARKKFVKNVKKKTVRRYKNVKKKTVRRYKKTKRAVIRKKKKAVRRFKRVKRSFVRKKKKVVKGLQKRRRRINREKLKNERQQFRRKTLKDEIDVLTTSSRRNSNENTAFIQDFGNDSGASRPGEPPKLRTGNGQMAIKSQLISHKTKRNNVTSRVYVDKRKAPYMAMWEYRQDGEARPFLKPSLENNKRMFGGIIGRKLKQKLKALK